MANLWSIAPSSEREAAELAHDTIVGDRLTTVGVRRLVEESWRRSLERHVDPDRINPGFDLDDDALRAYRQEHPLALVLPVIHRLLIQHTFEACLIVAIGDQAGRLLWIDGDRDLRHRAEGMLFVEGANWSEAAVGTSAPGTALALDHAIQIGGAEHFNRIVHPWSCTAVPVHDPGSGDVLGVIDITGGANAVSVATMPLLEAAAAAAEAELRIHQLRTHPPQHAPRSGRIGGGGSSDTGTGTGSSTGQRHPASSVTRTRVTDAPLLSVLGREVGRLTAGGRTIELSARHTEIMTLLAWHQHGLSASQLAQKLYPGENAVATLRAEMVRLRQVLAELGPDLQLDSRPYRLVPSLELDAHRVLAFLDRGAHRVALAAYAGPVAIGSTAPGVIDIRCEVAGAVRESLLADASAETLLSFARSDDCAYDREVWAECLKRLPLQSPKRASVVARLERIDLEVGRSV